jgi:uncharacterized protein (DUF2236 family)
MLESSLDAFASRLMKPPGATYVDFTQPRGEPALVGADSLSWRIFRNPLAVFVGGVAAVILELAEPAVRTGVWEHSGFRRDPLRRLQRTGHAAMITVYGPRSVARMHIAKVVQMHERITGTTPAGEPYSANDVKLLDWVQATATFGFAEAYSRLVAPLDEAQVSQLFAEGRDAAQLFGAVTAPQSQPAWQSLLESMRARLEPSPIVHEFLTIMRRAPVLPAPLRPMQRIAVRAAIEITPGWVRERLDIERGLGLAPWQMSLLRRAGRLADRLVLPSSPAVQSCLRLGLPADYLVSARA